MIRLMYNILEAEKAYEFDPVLGCRIYTLYNCYDNDYPFLRLWVALDEEENITACISVMSGIATIAASENCDFEEIACFFGKDPTIDVFEIQESLGKKLNEALKLPFHTRPIMEYTSREKYSGPNAPVYSGVLQYAFEILEQSDPEFDNTDFMAWFYDMMKRTKYEFSEVFAIQIDEKWVSTAGYYICSPISCVIGGVATLPEYRNRGFAGELIKYVVDVIKIKQKDPYLIAANDGLVKFYSKLGFEHICNEMCIEKTPVTALEE